MFLKFFSFRLVIFVVSILIVGILIGVGGTFLYIQKFGIPFKTVLQKVAQVEQTKINQELIGKVGKLIVLPEGEDPVLATITDATSLIKEQPFYAGTNNGDVVLMYQKALKAIIYSPDRNIIVNVGPITVQSNDQDTPIVTSPVPTPEIVE